MADILSQKEIDDLMTSAGGMDDMDDVGGPDFEEHNEGGAAGPRPKSFPIPKKQHSKFHFPYKTPVIKSRGFILNPTPEFEPADHDVVVRSLTNYTQYIRSKNAAAVR